MLKKIRMDLIFKGIQEYYQYLKHFEEEKKVQCSHLFVAKIMNEGLEVDQFFEQSTNQNIIDI